MSDHERGAYTPQPDAPLSFDPRTSREGRPLPLALIASCIVLATLVVALFMFYQSGMRRSSDAPTPVGTPVDQFRSPPPANGQAPEGLTVVAAAPPTEAPPPAPGVTEKPVERGATAPVQPAPTPMPTVAAPPPPPASAQRAVVEAPPPPVAKPVVTAKAEPAPHPAAAKPAAAKPHADPVGALLETSKAAKPVKVAAAKPAKPAAEPAPAAVAKGAAVVQIGAYISEAQATDAWRRVSGLMGGESSGRGRLIEPVEANGSTRYRSQFTGFASRADAVKFCTTLKAKSQDCIVKSAN